MRNILVLTIFCLGLITFIWCGETSAQDGIKNDICLGCHANILKWKTGKKGVIQPHRLHLESKNKAYNGRQKLCVTCHEAWVPESPGWMGSGIHHPETAMKPDGVWKKYIVRKDTHGMPFLEAVQPADPYTFKPLLKRLVCVDCHGPDSKVKVFYGLAEK